MPCESYSSFSAEGAFFIKFFPEIHHSSPEAAPAAFYKLEVRGVTEFDNGEAH